MTPESVLQVSKVKRASSLFYKIGIKDIMIEICAL